MTFSQYVEYFRNLAIQHPELCHQEPKNQVFTIAAWEEDLGKYRSSLQEKGFQVILMNPTKSFDSDANKQCCVTWQGGIIIAHYHSDRKEGCDDYINAMNAAELVANDFLDRMFAEALAGVEPFAGCKIENCEDLITGMYPMNCIGDTNYSGWLIQFKISRFNERIGCKAPAVPWKDDFEPRTIGDGWG